MAKLIDLNGLAHVYSIIKGMLADKLGKNDTAAAAIKDDAGNTISTTYASKADVSALMSTKLGVTATAYAATRDGAGNNIVNTYAKKTDISGFVKTVNGTVPDAGGNVNVEEYTHPNSGVTAGTYRSVTVNAQGHVTGGSNPTLAIANGGTGATTATQALANLGGVHSVNNTNADSNGNVNLGNLEKVNSSGTNYIRYESGLQICWGFDIGGGVQLWNFPQPFVSLPVVVGTHRTGRELYGFITTAYLTNTGCKFVFCGRANNGTVEIHNDANADACAIVIGRWK